MDQTTDTKIDPDCNIWTGQHCRSRASQILHPGASEVSLLIGQLVRDRSKNFGLFTNY